ncbi:MAG: Holliday junction branch migration protein RuvA [Candidatus Eisenbacteria sp.]|nr:Holliday junction branch migration protein RuvA [Candidatus Eisenbacteria bacterium]
MIWRIKGKILDKGPSYLVIDVAGVGILVHTPVGLFDRLGGVGDEAELLTHFHIREDALDLYGFAEEKERRLFRMLLGVSGIGPRSALGILSGMNTDVLQTAILSGDVASLICIPGVGRKTAQRIVVELKGPLSEGLPELSLGGAVGTGGNKLSGAVEALEALGLRRSDAYRSAAKVLQDAGEHIGLEDVVRLVLSGSAARPAGGKTEETEAEVGK